MQSADCGLSLITSPMTSNWASALPMQGIAWLSRALSLKPFCPITGSRNSSTINFAGDAPSAALVLADPFEVVRANAQSLAQFQKRRYRLWRELYLAGDVIARDLKINILHAP